MDTNTPPNDSGSAKNDTKTAHTASTVFDDQRVPVGNRVVVTDHYVAKDIINEPTKFKYKIFVRLNAKGVTFKRASFEHCIFDSCYLNNCVFDTCDFTGCKFIGSNFHQTAFAGCTFDYATFERCQIDNDILHSEAPREENLRMRFARSLRMNYQQIGDAKAVNQAISLELQATSIYLLKSWSSHETYYQKKFGGLKRIPQFAIWIEFWLLDFIWGNGESIVKLLRTILLVLLAISAYDTVLNRNPMRLDDFWVSLTRAPAEFLGVYSPMQFPSGACAAIAATRLVTFALLTAMLVKRFGRR
ncbi:pentapeptide repeat-containing protein [Burkholderia contaminans]|uniref:pentapeptide repeat-containing protein n=1 Tax=Burkholderia contaminans TaxID=488447 RepID=UPI003D67F296